MDLKSKTVKQFCRAINGFKLELNYYSIIDELVESERFDLLRSLMNDTSLPIWWFQVGLSGEVLIKCLPESKRLIFEMAPKNIPFEFAKHLIDTNQLETKYLTLLLAIDEQLFLDFIDQTELQKDYVKVGYIAGNCVKFMDAFSEYLIPAVEITIQDINCLRGIDLTKIPALTLNFVGVQDMPEDVWIELQKCKIKKVINPYYAATYGQSFPYDWKNADLAYFLNKKNLHPDLEYLLNVKSPDFLTQLISINKLCGYFEYDYSLLLEKGELTPELEMHIADNLDTFICIGYAFLDRPLISHRIAEKKHFMQPMKHTFACSDFRKIGPYLGMIPFELDYAKQIVQQSDCLYLNPEFGTIECVNSPAKSARK